MSGYEPTYSGTRGKSSRSPASHTQDEYNNYNPRKRNDDTFSEFDGAKLNHLDNAAALT